MLYFQNGSLLYDDEVYDHNEFCFEITHDSIARVYFCFPEQEEDFSVIIHSIGMLYAVDLLLI